MIKKFFYSVHRIAGTAIALLFLMWFVTGLVLFYHPYPRITEAQTNNMKDPLSDSLPDIKAFLPAGGGFDSVQSVRFDTIQSIEIGQRDDQTIVRISTPDSTYKYAGDTLHQPKRMTFDDIRLTACRWACTDESKIVRVDTLHELTQWVMVSRLEKMLPIYRFYFDDEDGHEVFVAKRSGSVVQMTTRSERIWSWLGAIPHKFYFPVLRNNIDLWKAAITIGGILCLLTAVSGMYIGVHIFIRSSRKKRSLVNPYKKFFHRWHYAIGLVVGVFIIGWGISGAMSMQKIPEWLAPGANRFSHHNLELWGDEPLDLDAFALDYRKVAKAYPEIKEVHWLMMSGHPVYCAVVDDSEVYIDAADTVVRPLSLTDAEIIARVGALTSTEDVITVHEQDNYDNYYMSRNESLPLPVCRVDIDDQYGSTFYVDRHSSSAKYFNDNRRWRKWMFSAPHYLNIAFMAEHPLIWQICLWILCLSGIAVSFTGVVLGWKYIGRKIKKLDK